MFYVFKNCDMNFLCYGQGIFKGNGKERERRGEECVCVYQKERFYIFYKEMLYILYILYIINKL